MNAPKTFLWHDYETFGIHAGLDRPVQFAALRTDAELQPVGEPLSLYCAPALDTLPHPGACLVTGITPQLAARRGVSEAVFAETIHDAMMEPGTCSVGYNSLRFDDEFSRNLFYRNLRDPYEREYKNGNSRWDLIDLARMCYALRPEGIEWPINDKGVASFKLEDLTAANGIEHGDAHDALADVQATIEFARLLKTAQGRLFDWALGMRDQKAVQKMLDTAHPKMLLHTSARVPAQRGCTSLFLPLAQVPDQPKSIIAFDLMGDPTALLTESAERIRDLVFTSTADLPEGVERLPLKTIRANKVPMLAPVNTLAGTDCARIGLDPERCQAHADRLLPQLDNIRYKLMDVFTWPPADTQQDPELLLYGGDFFSGHDKSLLARAVKSDAQALSSESWPFKDSRLVTLLFRYRARNFPDSLNDEEMARWRDDCRTRVLTPPLHGRAGLRELQTEIQVLRKQRVKDASALKLLDQLDAWYVHMAEQLDIHSEAT